MRTNWYEVALAVGSIKEGDPNSESGSTRYAEEALEKILGDEWIKDTVEYAISFQPGANLAMNCLRHIHSEAACIYAYEVYSSSDGERANTAVWLIKHLANRISFQWVDEFLDDPNVAGWGLGVLDQLLWCEVIEYDEQVEKLLQKASVNSDGGLDELVDFIRGYLKDRNDE